MADIEDQLAELKQQLAEKESRAAAESAAADRAEEQRRQHEQTMQLLNQLMGKQGGGGAEEQKNQGGEAQAAPVTGGEVENPAPSTPQEDSAANSVVPVEDGPHVINLARADKTETTVSKVRPLIHTGVEDLFELR